MDQVTIRPLTEADLDRVADIHCRAFKDSALTKLGKEAVKRYYRWLITGPHYALNIVACQNEQVVGFCNGGIFNGALSGFIRTNQRYLTIYILTHPWLISHEIVRDRIVATINRMKRGKPKISNVASTPVERAYGILAIAVDPDIQSKGIGKLLMGLEEMQARKGGFSQMRLTVHPCNAQAIHFYEGLGWQKVLTSPQNWKGSMMKSLQ